MALATKMSPACEPDVPVDTVTLAPPSAVISVDALRTLSSPLAVKLSLPERTPLSLTVLVVSSEMVRLYGSSSSVPKPPGPERSVKPA